MARIQLAYPKIPGSKNPPTGPCIAFEKYDGTNLHWVWEPELGWYAFGVRRNRYDLDEVGIREFCRSHRGLETAPEIFRRDFAEPLTELIRANPQWNEGEVMAFTEFLGPNSFAGLHKADDPKELVLIDFQVGDAILPPEVFLGTFQSVVPTARAIYRGAVTGKFVMDVREGRFNVDEGVVCKGVTREGTPWMIKIKTNAYMQRLREAFREDWESYWE